MNTNQIDLTPAWVEVLPAYVAVLESGKAETRSVAREQLRKMAQVADRGNRCAKTLGEIASLLQNTRAGLDNEDQPGGPQCPTGDTYNELVNSLQHILVKGGAR